MKPRARSLGVLITLLLLAGCAPTATQLLTLPEDALAQRSLQTRQFTTRDEAQVLTACTAILQDMGFQIDETNLRLRVLRASKTRDTNPLRPEARVAATLLSLGILSGFAMNMPAVIEVSVVTGRVGPGEDGTSVRVNFRMTRLQPNGQRGFSKTITEPELYTQFFDSLSKALFLEARES